MRKPMSESTTASAAEDRAAIERWEGEGGSVLALASSSARSFDLPRSGAQPPAGGANGAPNPESNMSAN